MTSFWEIFSSSFMLLAFLGAAYGVYSLLQIVQAKTSSTTDSLKSKGLNYKDGRLSVKTDRAAPTREEYLASTQRAFEKGGQVFKSNPDAFKMGGVSAVEGKSSGIESTPDKKGFKRGKKLD